MALLILSQVSLGTNLIPAWDREAAELRKREDWRGSGITLNTRFGGLVKKNVERNRRIAALRAGFWAVSSGASLAVPRKIPRQRLAGI